MLRPSKGENEPGQAIRKKEKGKSREAATCPTNIVSHWGPFARPIFVSQCGPPDAARRALPEMCRTQICRSEHRYASHSKDDAELKKAQVFPIFCRRRAKWHSA